MSALGLVLALTVAAPDAGSDRTEAMTNALRAMLHLQPMMLSDAAFSKPANRAAIDADLEALAMVEHGFRSADANDPGARSIAAVLSGHVARARAALAQGDAPRARGQLAGLSTLCFSCHTLSETTESPSAGSIVAMGLTPFEQARFLAATRRFDEALELWLMALKRPPKTFEQATEQINALRQALVVSVSVKDSPAKTLELLEAIATGEVRASYALPWSQAWRAETRAWAQEHFDARARSPQELFVRARTLVERSGAGQHLLGDESKTIGLLRATAYFTQALARQPQARWRSEALLGLGVAASTVREPMLWGLGDVYLEACIRENPGTPVAQRCFSTLLARTLFGFTGSSGTHVPPDVDAHLADLAALAQPRAPPLR